MNTTTIAELSSKNLLHNLSIFKAKAPQSQIIAMIKANAYGHGLRSVALKLEPHVAMLGVARIEEALALRKAQVKIPLLLMEGIFNKSEVKDAKEHNFSIVVHNHEQAEWLNQQEHPSTWLKINTGMGRLGFNLAEAQKIYDQIKPAGVISHLACADDLDHPLNHLQFKNYLDFISNKNILKSINNSAGIINFPQYNFDFVRPGLGLYGASPLKEDSDLDLKPVMTLKAKIISMQRYSKGQSLGYGARYACPRDMLVGVIAIGYGDGYPITAKDGTPILVNNIICPLIGRVSMDMITIDLSNALDAKVGDYVTLWGEGLPINDVARHTQNLPYDLLCGVQNRVVFHWS